MSQDRRRRLAARERRHPRPAAKAVLDQFRAPHLGRFSQGAERLPVGRYGDGLDHQADDAPSRLHVGCFSHGIDHSDC